MFWALTAPHGHAKNFSLRLSAGGRYQLTPLYDTLSTYPIQGRKTNRFDPRHGPLAMALALEGRNRHYALREIHRWHWVAIAERPGFAASVKSIIAELIEHTPAAGTMAGIKRPAREPDRRPPHTTSLDQPSQPPMISFSASSWFRSGAAELRLPVSGPWGVAMISAFLSYLCLETCS